MRVRSEALPFGLPPAVAAATCFALGRPVAGTLLAVITMAVAAFFRDPERHPPADAGTALSPADGRVVAVEEADGQTLVAIFLALWNVHVARAPLAAHVTSTTFYPGGYEPAFRPAASRNARFVFGLRDGDSDAELSLIAGFVARRVVPWVQEGDSVRRGERLALIRFGSRAELRLPRGYAPTVVPGDGVRAGETVIARARRPEPDER